MGIDYVLKTWTEIDLIADIWDSYIFNEKRKKEDKERYH